MRKIEEIIIHCSDTVEGKNISITDIEKWHKKRGFTKIGYHFVIYLNGEVKQGRNIKEIGAHCKRHNSRSIGICYIGGRDKKGNPKDTRTEEQKDSIRKLIKELQMKYTGIKKVVGHREYNSGKMCPCYDVNGEDFFK